MGESANAAAAAGSAAGRERFIGQIAELMPVVINVFDLETERDLYISASVQTLLGYTPDEVAGMGDPVSTFWHPDDVSMARAHLARSRTAADGEISEVEYRVRHRDGEWRWLATRSMPFARNDRGNVRQIITTTVDITRRKHADDALQRAHAELEQEVLSRTRQLRQVGDELAADVEAMNRLHELSTRLLTADGLQSLLEEILDATIDLQHADFGVVQLRNPHTKALDIVAHRGFGREFLEHFQAVVAGDGAVCGRAMEWGARVTIEDVQTDPAFAPHRDIAARAGFRAVQSTPLFSRAGETLGILSTHFRQPHRPSESELRLTDLYVLQAAQMVERKRAEEKLRRSETNLAEGQRISHTGSWAWNVSTGELYWSAEHFRICGVDPGSFTLTLESGRRLIHPDDFAGASQAFERAVALRIDYRNDLRMVRPDGAVVHVHSVGRPVFTESGELTEYVGTILDITERKEEEEVRKELSRRLLVAQEDERRRISRELHDQFGQQLSALKLKLANLKQNHGDRTNLDEELGAVEEMARQLDSDVDFIAWQLRPTALDDLGLPTALTNYVHAWSGRFEVQAELHVSGVNGRGLTDEIDITLYRVLQEALNNVAKHAHAKQVQILLEKRPDHVSLIVEDNGHGFDADRAFTGRTQLGLIGMRERAVLLGGTLEIESRKGGGTTVVARIPVPAQ